MADLEKNLEQAIEEAMQPNSKAEKGDSKPVKQGSSDAASIESGKGEVVKPEENPVDKAVASIKSAEKGTKEVSGDPQQKGESSPEPQPKLKKVSEDDVIRVKIIGTRFELNDTYISVIAELDNTDFAKRNQQPNKPYIIKE